MDTKLLVDAVVQQTTVLIAHLSTAAGLRAPLAHVADQVFVELAREIERQGVSRKVAADMFGLALRTYQKKVQRLTESVTDHQQTLWGAILDYITTEGTVPRRQLMHRFRYDGQRQVGAVLNDLVSTGLLHKTGRGDNAVYGITDEDEYLQYVRQENTEPLSFVVWVTVYRHAGVTREELCAIMPFEADEIETALDEALSDGRVEQREEDGASHLHASTFIVPVGSREGWEAAVFDHFQAVCNAIATKLQTSGPGSQRDDVVGGATLSFDIREGHPFEEQVLSLLKRVRADVNVLWTAVSEYNKLNPIPEDEKTKVSFYFGQYLTSSVDDDEDAEQSE